MKINKYLFMIAMLLPLASAAGQFSFFNGPPSGGGGSGGVSSFTGDGTILNNSASTGAVTATLANATAHSLLGNPGSTPAPYSAITLGSGLSFSGSTLTASGTGGTVTSVGISTNASYLTAGSPVTTTGNITFNRTTGLTANQVVATPNGSAGVADLRSLVTADLPANDATMDIPFTIDGGGNVLTTGTKVRISHIAFSGTITGWSLVADQAGSVTITIWKVNNAVPTIANIITASAPLTLSSSQQIQSTTLTGWTTSVAAGDVIFVQVTAASGVTYVSGSLQVTRT